MSTQLRPGRQGLSAAQDHEYCSPASTNISEPVIYVSPPYIIDHPEILHEGGLCPMYHNVMFRHSERTDCRPAGPESRQESKDVVPQDFAGPLEASSMQTLEELVAKLEFENELNRVCGNLKVTTTTQLPPPPLPPDRGSHSTESADSGVEEGDVEEDTGVEEDVLAGLLDMVLEMEQDYDLDF